MMIICQVTSFHRYSKEAVFIPYDDNDDSDYDDDDVHNDDDDAGDENDETFCKMRTLTMIGS